MTENAFPPPPIAVPPERPGSLFDRFLKLTPPRPWWDRRPGEPPVGPVHPTTSPVYLPGAAPTAWPPPAPRDPAASPWSPPPPPPPPPPPGAITTGSPGHAEVVAPPAPAGPYVPSWGLGEVGISILILICVQIAVAVAVALSGASEEQILNPSPRLLVVFVVANWLGLAPWPIIVSKWQGSGSLRDDFGLSFEWFDVVRGIVAAVAFYGVSLAAVAIWWVFTQNTETPSNSDIVDPNTVSAVEAALLLLVVAVITPIVEEFYFRGFLLRAIGKRFGIPISIVVSSLFFGALHFAGGLDGLWLVGLLSLYGMVLAVTTARSGGRLGPGIIAHAINNGVTLLVVLFG